MPDELLEKLARNILDQGRYPPPIVRSYPELPEEFQEIDGHQRIEVLRRLGHDAALCYVWECDDATALTLLSTLNRIHGEDVPARRAMLLAELNKMIPTDVMATLLPEDASAIEQLLAMSGVRHGQAARRLDQQDRA